MVSKCVRVLTLGLFTRFLLDDMANNQAVRNALSAVRDSFVSRHQDVIPNCTCCVCTAETPQASQSLAPVRSAVSRIELPLEPIMASVRQQYEAMVADSDQSIALLKNEKQQVLLHYCQSYNLVSAPHAHATGSTFCCAWCGIPVLFDSGMLTAAR